MGNSGGCSGGGFLADRRCAAPREDGARLAKPRNLCIDGVQDVVVQVRSFRSIARITGWPGDDRRLWVKWNCRSLVPRDDKARDDKWSLEVWRSSISLVFITIIVTFKVSPERHQ